MFGQIRVIVSLTTLVMLSPGPDMVLVLRNTLVGGRRAGLQTSVGILSGNVVHITYCLSKLLHQESNQTTRLRSVTSLITCQKLRRTHP